MHVSSWKWKHYYWNACKQFGRECYRTYRWELLASIVVGFFVAVLSGNWKDFRTALLATALTIGCFATWHMLRTTFLLHKSIHGDRQEKEAAVWEGVVGALVITGMVAGGLLLNSYLWEVRTETEIIAKFPPVSVPTIAFREPPTPAPPKAQLNPAGPALPNLTWTQEHALDPDGKPTVTVSFRTDGPALDHPGFVAICDRPGRVARTQAGVMSHEPDITWVGRRDLAGAYFDMPKPMPPGTPGTITIVSEDNTPVKIVAFRILNESEIPVELH